MSNQAINNQTLNATKTSVRVIGANGQISLGKDYAGKQVLIEEREPGVWLVRTAVVIPENEQWLHEPKRVSDLREAMAWSLANKPKVSDVDALFQSLDNEPKPANPARRTRSK